VSAAGQRTALSLLLAALCFAIYAQVRHHEFVDYDDYITILNYDALEVSSIPEAVRVALTPYHANWIPLTTLSLALDRWLYGSEPRGYLLTNVALHALASVLLFLALDAMTGAAWRSAFVAAVFAAHPLHVESVAWATERKDVLCGVFWMLALVAHGRYAARPQSGLRYASVLACVILALLAKPMAVTLPCVLLLLDYWPLGRLSRRAVLEKLPMFAAVVAISIVAVVTQQGVDSLDFGELLPITVRVANAIDGYGIYVWQSLWPSGLAAFYPYTGGLPSPARPLVAAALCAATAAAFVLRRSRPYLIVGWLWFLGTLVPVVGLVQVGPQGHADRYMYLPQIGLAIALAWGATDLARKRLPRWAPAAAALALVAALSAAAWVQVGFWRDSFTLFERVLEIAPNAYLPHERLATLYVGAGQIELAGPHLQRAFEIDPAQGRENLVHFELGSADLALSRAQPDTALKHWREAVRADPEHPRANRLLGLALVARNRAAEAKPHLEQALREEPPDASVHAALARLASADGKPGEAVEHFREALRLAPRLASLRNDLAWLLATAADPALRSPEEAVRLAEDLDSPARTPSANELDTLAVAYAAAGRYEDALRAARRALALAQPQDPRLARQIEMRVREFERGRAWLEPASASAAAGAAARSSGGR